MIAEVECAPEPLIEIAVVINSELNLSPLQILTQPRSPPQNQSTAHLPLTRSHRGLTSMPNQKNSRCL